MKLQRVETEFGEWIILGEVLQLDIAEGDSYFEIWVGYGCLMSVSVTKLWLRERPLAEKEPWIS